MRTLIIVPDRRAAGPPSPATDYLVLDMAWTPAPHERPDLLAVRPLVQGVVARRNLFEASLAVLDAYAEAGALADRFMERGVTWWHHARSFLSLGVHERLLWAHVLADLVRSSAYGRLVIRVDRAALVEAAMALDVSIRPEIKDRRPSHHAHPGDDGEVEAQADVLPDNTSIVWARVEAAQRLARQAARAVRSRLPAPLRYVSQAMSRVMLLEERLNELAAQPERVMAVVVAASFHTVTHDGTERLGDPYVSPVVDRLAGEGVSVSIVGMGLDHRNDDDWAEIEGDPRLIPISAVRFWLGRRNPRYRATAWEKRLLDLPPIQLRDDGFDLGPAVRSLVVGVDRWFALQRVGLALAEDLIRAVRPGVLLTGWEGARTAWLGAARILDVPAVAVQHGVIYPGTPDYVRSPHGGLVRADLTCVFGPYERELLIDKGGYQPDAVVVTGSPRIDPVRVRVAPDADEGNAVRRDLGVATGDRVLLLSAGRRFVGDVVHGLSMAARLLGGPLPGIHVVIKLHPESTGEERYEELLAGLAAAGGYEAPPVSLVRDIDLYRLLRSVDAHLGLYSTVLTDAVLTGTPNMIAIGQAWVDAIGYIDARVATPVATVDEVRAFMADPQRPSAEDRQRFIDEHYLAGDATGRIVAAIRGVRRA